MLGKAAWRRRRRGVFTKMTRRKPDHLGLKKDFLQLMEGALLSPPRPGAVEKVRAKTAANCSESLGLFLVSAMPGNASGWPLLLACSVVHAPRSTCQGDGEE